MSSKRGRVPFVAPLRLIAALLALWVLPLWVMPATAGEANALRPVDTSSPRATLQGFLEFMNEGYGAGVGLITSYLASSRLYFTPDEVATLGRSIRYQEAAQRSLD